MEQKREIERKDREIKIETLILWRWKYQWTIQ
jgi:hypothetical protein